MNSEIEEKKKCPVFQFEFKELMKYLKDSEYFLKEINCPVSKKLSEKSKKIQDNFKEKKIFL